MRQSVRDAFMKITVAWEGGYINWMFPDVKGLVSTGFGLLIDPVAMALTLPWKLNGQLADRDFIVSDFYNVKNFPNAARLGHRSVMNVAKLRLDHADMDRAVMAKIANNETVIRKGFPEYDDWPADAQLGMLSMAWACGPGIWSPSAGRNYWPKLTNALRTRDFRTAAVECFMNEERTNPGIRPRNAGNRVMFNNAAVSQGTFDPETLFYPTDLESSPVGPDDPTQPKLVPVVEFSIVHPDVPLPDNEPPDDAA